MNYFLEDHMRLHSDKWKTLSNNHFKAYNKDYNVQNYFHRNGPINQKIKLTKDLLQTHENV